MKRRWQRFVLMAGTAVLAALLVALVLVVWLHKSGRLATLSQQALQRLSGQEVTFDAISFPAWDTVAFTNVRLQYHVPGWRLTGDFPRLEVRYGLLGLLNKQVDHLHLQQPRLTVTRRDESPPAPSSPPADSRPVAVLPLNRLTLHQGTLHVRWNHQTYTVQQLDATLRPQGENALQAEVSGRLQDRTATFRMMAHMSLGKAPPTGRLHFSASMVPIALVAQAFSQALPRDWKVTQGILDVDTNLNIQGHTMQGRVTATLAQVTAQVQGTTIQQGTFSTTEATIAADFAQQTIRVEGQAQLQAAQASAGPDIALTHLSGSTEGTIDADFAQQTIRVEGQAQLRAAQANAASDMILTTLSSSTKATLQGNYAQQTLDARGQTRLQIKRARKAPDISMTKISLSIPWRWSHRPAHWQVTVTPALQSHTAEIGTLVRASGLSLSTDSPMQIRYQAQGLQMQGTPTFAVRTLHIRPGGQPETALHISGVQGKLSLRGSPTSLELTEVQMQTQAWQQQTADGTQLLKALSLQASGSVDLQRQRLSVRDLTIKLPQLGNLSGSGTWHWPSHTLHDLQVQLAPTAVDTLQESLHDLLPAAYRAWQVAGQTELHLRVPRLSLRAPQRLEHLVIDWQVHDGAFSSPDGVYSGEHLQGMLQATAAFDAAAGQVTVQGTLTLHPFALLVGSVFPAIEENHMTSVVTFSGIYNHATERLTMNLAGQFRHLGTVALQGVVHRPIGGATVDLQVHLRAVQMARLWNIFIADPIRFPTLSQAEVRGTLSANMRLQGQPTTLTLQGTLDVRDGHFQSGSVVVQGASLALPLQVYYPLPDIAPPMTALSPDAYGHLKIDALHIGNLTLDHLRIGLALRSDTVLFQRGLTVPLWGGQLALEDITAQHVLQPHRWVALRARLRNLDLQRLRRGTTKLPLAGIVNGTFARVQIRGDRLETQGSLTIHIAGGVVRVADVQGRDLFSALPTLQGSISTEQPLSLLRLTSIYPIGSIGGTVRFSVTDLTITAGEPAAFLLDFAVEHKGGEKRQITVRALNNLLFTTGSANVAAGLFGDAYRLRYKRFGARVTLRHDTLRLRGKYHNRKGTEYFMRAPALGSGVSIVNRVPENGIPFRDFLQRLKTTVLETPSVQTQ